MKRIWRHRVYLSESRKTALARVVASSMAGSTQYPLLRPNALSRSSCRRVAGRSHGGGHGAARLARLRCVAQWRGNEPLSVPNFLHIALRMPETGSWSPWDTQRTTFCSEWAIVLHRPNRNKKWGAYFTTSYYQATNMATVCEPRLLPDASSAAKASTPLAMKMRGSSISVALFRSRRRLASRLPVSRGLSHARSAQPIWAVSWPAGPRPNWNAESIVIRTSFSVGDLHFWNHSGVCSREAARSLYSVVRPADFHRAWMGRGFICGRSCRDRIQVGSAQPCSLFSLHAPSVTMWYC